MKRNIILIGMPGSGKTTVGKLLALMAGMAFVDSDALIEKKECKSISDIFAEHGESYFREKEALTLLELSKRKNTVISCGGGAVLNPQNMEQLKKSGAIVWLKIDPQKLLARLKSSDNRPLIKKSDGLSEIEQTLNIRQPLYEKYSDIQLSSDNLSPPQSAEQILKLLGKH